MLFHIRNQGSLIGCLLYLATLKAPGKCGESGDALYTKIKHGYVWGLSSRDIVIDVSIKIVYFDIR